MGLEGPGRGRVRRDTSKYMSDRKYIAKKHVYSICISFIMTENNIYHGITNVYPHYVWSKISCSARLGLDKVWLKH